MWNITENLKPIMCHPLTWCPTLHFQHATLFAIRTNIVLKNSINYVDKDVQSLASTHYKNSLVFLWRHFNWHPLVFILRLTLLLTWKLVDVCKLKCIYKNMGVLISSDMWYFKMLSLNHFFLTNVYFTLIMQWWLHHTWLLCVVSHGQLWMEFWLYSPIWTLLCRL